MEEEQTQKPLEAPSAGRVGLGARVADAQHAQTGAARQPEPPAALGRQAQVWAEEARIEGAATAQAEAIAASDVALGINETTGDRLAQTGRSLGRRVGRVVGLVRGTNRESIADGARNVVRQHPNTILAAAAAGFLIGRALRRR